MPLLSKCPKCGGAIAFLDVGLYDYHHIGVKEAYYTAETTSSEETLSRAVSYTKRDRTAPYKSQNPRSDRTLIKCDRSWGLWVGVWSGWGPGLFRSRHKPPGTLVPG
ncbi:MAG: hypothetical protein V7L01_05065 [Nostoc sp.]|uniref:hypothetical protein n=1 Tax=Nostoc sp. TaxID=1180 RepID=UPI002FF7407F